jgi:protein TonB
MEPKKSPKADLEGWRAVFFEAGLVVALLAVIAMLGWNMERRPVEAIDWQTMLSGDEAIDVPWQDQLGLRPVDIRPPHEDLSDGRSDVIRAVSDQTVVRREQETALAAGLTLAEPPAAQTVEAVKAAAETQTGDEAAERQAVVDQIPRFMGGDPSETFRKWALARLNYPAAAVSRGVCGVVAVAFIIETDGSLSGFETIFSADPALAAEALRIARMSPPWEPAKRGGQSVRIRYIQPIEFGLASK